MPGTREEKERGGGADEEALSDRIKKNLEREEGHNVMGLNGRST